MNLEHLVKRGHPDARCNLFFCHNPNTKRYDAIPQLLHLTMVNLIVLVGFFKASKRIEIVNTFNHLKSSGAHGTCVP